MQTILLDYYTQVCIPKLFEVIQRNQLETETKAQKTSGAILGNPESLKKALGDKIKSVTIEEMMMYITLTKTQPDETMSSLWRQKGLHQTLYWTRQA